MTQPNQRLPTLEEYSNRENAMNTEGQNLRNYVDASIGAIQASLRRTIEERLAEILPQAIRNSILSQRNNSYQYSNNFENSRNANDEQNKQQTQNAQHLPNYSRYPHTQYLNQNLAMNYKPITTLHLQKWA